MANTATNTKKFSEVTVVSNTQANDRLIFVRSFANGTYDVESIAVANLFVYGTPANSTIAVAGGTLMYDNSYIYVAIANNHLMRAALTAF